MCEPTLAPFTGLTVMRLPLMVLLVSLSSGVSGTNTNDDRMVGSCKALSVTPGQLPGPLTNPNYPHLAYFNKTQPQQQNTERCWVIHMSTDIYKDHYIQVTLHDLDLHVPGDCSAADTDFVEFREGQSKMSSLVGRWCSGYVTPGITLTSCTGDLLVWLHLSDRSTNHRGLNISYNMVKRDTYDCHTRAPTVKKKLDLEDGAIAGVAIFLLVALFIIAIVVVLKTRQRPNNPDPRQSLSTENFWQRRSSGFDHQRFENEGYPADEDEIHAGVHASAHRDLSLGDSMRSTKPLPIGIPSGAYKADGFPAAYACNIPEINIHDLDFEDKANVKSSSQISTGENVIPMLSGLPAEPFGGEPIPEAAAAVPDLDPLAASVPANTSGMELGQALEEKLSGQRGQLSRSAPGGTGQEDIMLSFSEEGNPRDESYA